MLLRAVKLVHEETSANHFASRTSRCCERCVLAIASHVRFLVVWLRSALIA